MSTSTDAPLTRLRRQAADCTACELHRDATQTVFGAGPTTAWLMLIGEQPGDQEDRQGKPFVGPAGRMLDSALERAGIDRDQVYVTNAVKHFRFERDGNRRLHKTPAVGHVRACRQWLDGELAVVRPAVLATLGATAAKALLGSRFPDHRGARSASRVGGVPAGAHRAPVVHPARTAGGAGSGAGRAGRRPSGDRRAASREWGRIGCPPVTATRTRAGSPGDEGGFIRGQQ